MRTARFSDLLLTPVIFVVAVGSPCPVTAQEDASFAEFHFNRSLPGARSLAMAGAFVAVADDATAAYANPAGLTILTRREIALEGRQWTDTFSFTNAGRITGVPSGIGIDNRTGLEIQSGASSTQAISFLSYVDAVQHRRWVAAVFYRIYASYHTSFNSQGVFSTEGVVPRFGPYHFSSDFDVDSIGASWANQYGDCIEFRGCIRAGVTLASYSLKMDARQVIYPDPPNNGSANFSGRQLDSAERSGDDRSAAISVGVIWEPRSRLSVGAAFRQGPSFHIVQRVSGTRSSAQLSLPHEYSVGVRWRHDAGLLIGIEVTRILYSRLLAGNSLQGLRLADATEVRLGADFPLRQNEIGDKWLAMAGLWYDPDHTLTASTAPSTGLFRRSYFRGGTAQWHVTGGIGWHLGWMQTNLGIDLSRKTHTEALSFVWRL